MGYRGGIRLALTGQEVTSLQLPRSLFESHAGSPCREIATHIRTHANVLAEQTEWSVCIVELRRDADTIAVQ